MIVLDINEMDRASPSALNQTPVPCQNFSVFQFGAANQGLILDDSFVGHIKTQDPKPFGQLSEHGIRDESACLFHG